MSRLYEDTETVEQYPKCPWCLEIIERKIRKGKNTCPHCKKPFKAIRDDIVHKKIYYDTELIGVSRDNVKHLAYPGRNYKWHTNCGLRDIKGILYADVKKDGFKNWTTDTEEATCKECLKVELEQEQKKSSKAKKRLEELSSKRK